MSGMNSPLGPRMAGVGIAPGSTVGARIIAAFTISAPGTSAVQIPGATTAIVIETKAADGGGGASSYASGTGSQRTGGNGGSGGSSFTVAGQGITSLSVTVGQGGAGGVYGSSAPGNGGNTLVSNAGAVLCSANGGIGGTNATDPNLGSSGTNGAGGTAGVGQIANAGMSGAGGVGATGGTTPGNVGANGLVIIFCLG